jgi:hypothetical protein
MAIIDATIVVDVEATIRDTPNMSSGGYPIPTTLGKGDVFVTTQWNDVNFGLCAGGLISATQVMREGGYNLDIKAEINDRIRWRATSLAGGFGYQVYIQSFTAVAGNILLPTAKQHLMDAVPLPAQDASGNVFSIPGHDFYWETTITAAGYSAYHVSFAIFDSMGGRVGGFTVDPVIDVPGKRRGSFA